MAVSSRAGAVLKWGAISLAILVSLLLACVLLVQRNANALRGPIARIASGYVGRAIHIDGTLKLQLLSLTPYAAVDGLRVGNPQWARVPNMARVGRLEVSIDLLALLTTQIVIPRLSIEELELSLERDASDRANWRFEDLNNRRAPSRAVDLPLVRRLILEGWHIEVRDAIRKLHFNGTVAASESGGDAAQRLRLDGSGEMNGAPFALLATGDPLTSAARGQPYNCTANIRAGRTHLNLQARIANPLDVDALAATFTATGADLADLYYLTGLTLPNTPPYTLAGHLQTAGTHVDISQLAGMFGNSDLEGTMVIETGAARVLLTAQLLSRSLDIVDLGPSLGAASREDHPAPTSGKPLEKKLEPVPANALWLPDAQLDLGRVRGMDADVRYRAQSVNAQDIPFKEVAWRLRLDHGVMTIDPLSFVLPAGRIAARLRIDATRDVPDVAFDGRLIGIDLAQFHAHDSEPPLAGLLLGRFVVRGRGRSVHTVAAGANGAVTTAISRGQVRSAFAELTGINVARGLGLLLTKNQQKDDIRCAVADFNSTDGVVAARNIVVDTQNLRIIGKGSIDLRTERLHLSVDGEPKKLRFATLQSPIVIHGTLRKPTVGLDPAHLVKQAGFAIGLGALVAPLAVVLAFIDPGLVKDADCGALLASAGRTALPNSSQTETANALASHRQR
jgi:AsmA family protein